MLGAGGCCIRNTPNFCELVCVGGADWGGTREGVRQFAEVDGTSVSVVLVVSERGSELVVVLELVVLVVSERGSEQRIPCPLGITGSR